MSSDDSEWASGLFSSSVDEHDDISEVEWRRGDANRTSQGAPRVFERERTSPLASLSSVSEGSEVTRHDITKASGEALHERLMGWLSAIEAQRDLARLDVFSGGYNAPISFYVKRGVFISGPLLRGKPFFDLEFKRAVPELFTQTPDALDYWWGDEAGREPARHMILRLLVRSASLGRSPKELTFEPCEGDEYEGPGGTLSPLELLVEHPDENASQDLALQFNARCASTALMSWTWRRERGGIGTLGSHGEGATIDAATHALEAAHSLIAGAPKKDALGLVMVRFEGESWTACWTDEWLSLQLHQNTHLGRVMLARQELSRPST